LNAYPLSELAVIFFVSLPLYLGADDIFVFYDAWAASDLLDFGSLAERLSHCYRRAAASMFFTSFTTGAAFAVGGFSALLPLGSFGVFTAVLVGVNYLSVIIFFPCVLVTYHLYFEASCCPCTGCCRPPPTELPESSYSISAYHDNPGFDSDLAERSSPYIRSTHQVSTDLCSGEVVPADVVDVDATSIHGDVARRIRDTEDMDDQIPQQDGKEKMHVDAEPMGSTTSPVHISRETSFNVVDIECDSIGEEINGRHCASRSCNARHRKKKSAVEKRPNIVVVFFRDYYFAFITHKVVRIVIVIVFLCVIGFLTFWATKLEPDSEQVLYMFHKSIIIEWKCFTYAFGDLVWSYFIVKVKVNFLIYIADRKATTCI